MDGLVSNVALITGVAAAGARPHVVALTGLAGLLAGALSMAVGEWTSVRSQRHLIAAEISKERHELVHRPDAEEAELAGLYRSRGLSRNLAGQVARELSRDPEIAWRIHVREELGVDPDDLPSPYLAGASSLGSFATGALIPLLPYLLGFTHLWLSLVVAGIALVALRASTARFTARPAWRGAAEQRALGAGAAALPSAGGGASTARSTARPAWRGAAEQLALGAGAAAITYGVGSAFGVGLS